MGNPAHGEAACVRYGKAPAHKGESTLRGSGRLGEAGIAAQTGSWKGVRMAEGEFVRRLGEVGYGPNNARGELLDLLGCAGLIVHGGWCSRGGRTRSSCGRAAPCGTSGPSPSEERMPGSGLRRYGRGAPQIGRAHV